MSKLHRNLKSGLSYEDTQRRRCENAVSKVRSHRMMLLGKRGVRFDDNCSDSDTNEKECVDNMIDVWKCVYKYGIKRRNQKSSTIQCNMIVRGYEIYLSLCDPILELQSEKAVEIKDWRRLFDCDGSMLQGYSDNIDNINDILQECNQLNTDKLTLSIKYNNTLLRFLMLSSVELRKQLHQSVVYKQLLEQPQEFVLNMLTSPYSCLFREEKAPGQADELSGLFQTFGVKEEKGEQVLVTLDDMFKQRGKDSFSYKDRNFTTYVDWMWLSLSKAMRARMYIAGSGYNNHGTLPNYEDDNKNTDQQTSLFHIQGIEASVFSENELYTIFKTHFQNKLKNCTTVLQSLLLEAKVPDTNAFQTIGSTEIYASLQSQHPDHISTHAYLQFLQARKYGSVTPAYCLIPHSNSTIYDYLQEQLRNFLDTAENTTSTNATIDTGRCIPFASFYYSSLLPLLVTLSSKELIPITSCTKAMQLVAHASSESTVCYLLLTLLPNIVQCLYSTKSDLADMGSMLTFTLRTIGNIIREPGVQNLLSRKNNVLPIFHFDSYANTLITQFQQNDIFGPDYLKNQYIPDGGNNRMGANGQPDERNRKDLLYVSYRSHPSPFKFVRTDERASYVSVTVDKIEEVIGHVIYKHIGNSITTLTSHVLHEAQWVATALYMTHSTGVSLLLDNIHSPSKHANEEDEEEEMMQNEEYTPATISPHHLELVHVQSRQLEDYVNNDVCPLGAPTTHTAPIAMVPMSVLKLQRNASSTMRLHIARPVSKVSPEICLKAVELLSTILQQEKALQIHSLENLEATLLIPNKKNLSVLESILLGVPVCLGTNTTVIDLLRTLVKWVMIIIMTVQHTTVNLPQTLALVHKAWNVQVTDHTTHIATVADAAIYIQSQFMQSEIHPLELAESIQLDQVIQQLHRMPPDPVVQFLQRTFAPFLE